MTLQLLLGTPAVVIPANTIFGGPNYTHIINNGTDWQPGVAACAELVFTSTTVMSVGTKIIYRYIDEDFGNIATIGTFNISSRKRVKDKYTYTCYDYMMKLEETNVNDIWEDWWDSNQTKTLSNLVSYICTQCGLTFIGSFTNDGFTLDKQRFYCTNTTARQLLSYIAEVAGGYAYADAYGQIHIANLGTSVIKQFSRSEYKNASIGTDPINVIDSVWTGATSDDTGIIYEATSGTHDNVLKIVGNPLLYNDGPNISPTTQYNRVVNALPNIYAVAPTNYKAVDINTFTDFTTFPIWIKVGNKVLITEDGTNYDTFYVFSKYKSSSGVRFACTGNTNREVYISPYDNINGISTSVSSLKIDNDEIKAEVSDLNDDVSALTISVDSIDLSVTNSGTTSQIKLSKDGTVIASPTVTMTGKVSFSDLSTAGLTTINGANITTGTVNCDKLNVANQSIGSDLAVLSHLYAVDLHGNNLILTKPYLDPTHIQGTVVLKHITTSGGDIGAQATLSPSSVTLLDGTSKTWAQILAGGGGGTSDYDQLSNRPQINGVTLTGNKTSAQLGIVAKFG